MRPTVGEASATVPKTHPVVGPDGFPVMPGIDASALAAIPAPGPLPDRAKPPIVHQKSGKKRVMEHRAESKPQAKAKAKAKARTRRQPNVKITPRRNHLLQNAHGRAGC